MFSIMKRILPFFLILGSIPSVCPAQTQAGITAGQTTGLAHYVLQPAFVMDARRNQGASSTNLRDSLDLDKDGRFDITFSISLWANPSINNPNAFPYASTWIDVARSTEMLKIYNTSGNYHFPGPVALVLGDIIEDTNAPYSNTTTPPIPTWAPTPNRGGMLSHEFYTPMGTQIGGSWRDMQPHYIGFRFRNGAGWRYGWLKVQLSNITAGSRSTLTITEYAVQTSTALSVRSATKLSVHFFPNPTRDVLHIPVTEKGRLTIFDTVGKAVLSQDLTGQLEQSVSVSTLPAGSYFVDIQSSTGSIRRGRFDKF